MWSFFSSARVRQLSFFWSAVIIVGLFVSAWVLVLPSIGMAGLFLTGVGYALNQKRISQWRRWPELLSFLLVYLVHAVTGLAQNSWNNQELWRDLILQLPFILLPVAFLLLPDWEALHKRNTWFLLIACCLLAAIGATINYALHYKEIESLYLQSKVMPTEPDHIRFSLLVSIAVLAGIVLIFGRQLPYWVRLAIVLSVALLFLFQHMLAVRSGIVTMYAAGLLWLLWLGWQLRQWKTALAGVVLMVGLGTGCYLLFPTLRNKVTNTRNDASQLHSKGAAWVNYSVTARVYSFQAASAIIQDHPVIGVSKMQLPAKMAEQYRYSFPDIDPKRYVLPHNQFIYNLASYGVLGLLVFLFGYYYLLWVGIRQRNILLLLIYLIITVSFTVEYTLESNIGVVIGLFFPLLAATPTFTTSPEPADEPA
ncbi:MAG: O-antigen ligase family protein [Janthinobacterium lividum]